jgi:hypothetical protein
VETSTDFVRLYQTKMLLAIRTCAAGIAILSALFICYAPVLWTRVSASIKPGRVQQHIILQIDGYVADWIRVMHRPEQLIHKLDIVLPCQSMKRLVKNGPFVTDILPRTARQNRSLSEKSNEGLTRCS